MLTPALRFALLRLVHLFYPTIELKHSQQLPTSGPVIFVLNHPNGLLDPLVLIAALHRPVAFLAKSTFFANPIGRFLMATFGALPVYRQRDASAEARSRSESIAGNEATFARCHALLRAGAAIALFPEGTTHSGTTLLPLRTGAARIALGAEEAAEWRLGVQIVPVGLWYQHKTQFRSSVLLVVGTPFTLEAYAATYAADQREAVHALTERIDSALDSVVLQADHAELLNGIPLLARWIDADGETATLFEQHERTTMLLAAYERLRQTDPARLEAIANQARRYARILRTLGINDPWALELADVRRNRIAWLLCALVLMFPLALVGFALSYGTYRLAAPMTPLVVGRFDEVTSTGKLILGSVFVVLGWLLAALLCGWLAGFVWGCVLLLCAPLCAYSALRWGEWWREVREVFAAHWLRLRQRDLVHALAARRRSLADDVLQAVQRVELPVERP